jgi:hypothetical protein
VKYTYKLFDLKWDMQVEGTNMKLEGESIKNHLKGCNKVILMALTLSEEVDRLIRKQQLVGMADGLAVDTMASAAVEQACIQVEEEIMEKLPGKYFTWRFGVGYGDFPLQTQKEFVKVLNAQKVIGLCISDGMLLTPTKSVTCVMGVSDKPIDENRSLEIQLKKIKGNNSKGHSREKCETCNLRETCQFRKRGDSCGH